MSVFGACVATLVSRCPSTPVADIITRCGTFSPSVHAVPTPEHLKQFEALAVAMCDPPKPPNIPIAVKPPQTTPVSSPTTLNQILAITGGITAAGTVAVVAHYGSVAITALKSIKGAEILGLLGATATATGIAVYILFKPSEVAAGTLPKHLKNNPPIKN